MEKELRKGAKHFRPGAKVYCMPEFGGTAHEVIRVLGKPRKKKRMISIIIPSRHIKNYRIQKIYHPHAIRILKGHVFYWNRNTTPNWMAEIESLTHYLNTLTDKTN